MPRKILHVLGGMDRGGVETWLMHILRRVELKQFDMDFLVHTTRACAYDDEVRHRGSRIIPCPSVTRPWEYAANFKDILRKHGPYDVVHSHVHFYSGFVLRLAHRAGVPIRIAHSHNDTRLIQKNANLLRRGYFALARHWIHGHATCGLAASRRAGEALFGRSFESDPRWKTLYYGIDFSQFWDNSDLGGMRAEHGIPANAFVVGHVGRFCQQKNHKFFIRIAAELARRDPSTHFLLIGDGTLRPTITRLAQTAGLAERITFAGLRKNVCQIMRGAMDVFLFPSLFEGLGLVLLEAQAAGLPCVYSDVVPDEADVIPSLLTRLALDQPPRIWAEAVLARRNARATINRKYALQKMIDSRFNIEANLAQLSSIYAV